MVSRQRDGQTVFCQRQCGDSRAHLAVDPDECQVQLALGQAGHGFGAVDFTHEYRQMRMRPTQFIEQRGHGIQHGRRDRADVQHT
ncbi:hypothetical protein D3C72_2069750 [compost metagenome]